MFLDVLNLVKLFSLRHKPLKRGREPPLSKTFWKLEDISKLLTQIGVDREIAEDFTEHLML